MRPENRWWVVAIFYLSSSINYLDRMILNAISPEFMREYHLNYEQFGWIHTPFYVVYMISSPCLGWFLDRVGLNWGTAIALGWWSIMGMLRGGAQGLGSLITAHSLVAIGESAGIPSTAKAAQTYLKQDERAIGSSMSQIGLVIGITAASFVANFCISHWGWRSAFFVAGSIGFLWIPLWFWASRKAPKQVPSAESTGHDTRQILRMPQTWGFVVANILSLGIFALWTTWTNHYFIKTIQMTTAEANQIAPILQYVGLGGSFLGGWGSLRLIRKGWQPMTARRRVYLFGALGMTISAVVPLAPTPAWALVLISLSYGASSAASVNLYTMPLDAYGGSRAAFAVSLLTSGYGFLQLVISPLIGRVADQYNSFAPVCVAVAFPPLIAYLILEATKLRAPQTVRT